jgi:hypothetical protein
MTGQPGGVDAGLALVRASGRSRGDLSLASSATADRHKKAGDARAPPVNAKPWVNQPDPTSRIEPRAIFGGGRCSGYDHPFPIHVP